MFRTLSPGDCNSEALRKLLQDGRRGSQALYKFATKRADSRNIADQVLSWGIEHSMFGKMQASGRTEFIPLTYTSAIWGQACFLVHHAFCISPALQQSPWGVVAYTGSDWGALIHIWKPESTDGCDIFCLLIQQETASLVAQMVKNLSAMQETWVQSLGREDLLEKKMATPSSILAWRIPWTEEPGGVQSVVWQRAGHNWGTNTCGRRYFHFTPSSLCSCPLSLIWSLLGKVPNVEGRVCPGNTLFKFRIVLKERKDVTMAVCMPAQLLQSCPTLRSYGL